MDPDHEKEDKQGLRNEFEYTLLFHYLYPSYPKSLTVQEGTTCNGANCRPSSYFPDITLVSRNAVTLSAIGLPLIGTLPENGTSLLALFTG